MNGEQIQGELLQNETDNASELDSLHPLKAYRVRHGLTLAQMGEKAGLSLRSICNYENLDRYPKPVNVRKILAATSGEVTADMLQAAWARGQHDKVA